MTVALIDTSVFCELLGVPGKSRSAEQYQAEMNAKVAEREILLLPVTTILETGNHIGQCSRGDVRRHYAGKFVKIVIDAIDGK